MSGSNTNVPSPTFGATGFVAPAESAILTGALADLNSAFGANFNPALNTPQGQLSSSLAAIIGDQNATFLYYASQVDPAFASGRMQDAIGRIYFMTRIPGSPTSVSCTVTGNNGTVLPVGTLAQDVSGNTYSLVNAITFTTAAPSQTAEFANTVDGPIPCPANTLTIIYQSVSGWNSITNSADGVLGQNIETRQAFELRRQQSVAVNATGSLDAIQAAVLAVPNVLSAYTTQNNTSSTQTIGGVSVPANSIYVSVAGGTSQAIGNAIYAKAPPGIPTSGTTAVTVQDTQAGYSAPYPTYTVNYTQAASTPIYYAVTLANNSQVPSNAATLIQAAIVSAFAGGDGGVAATIGATLYASRMYAPVAMLGSWAQIVDIYIGLAAGPTGNIVTLNINQVPTIAASQITVTV
jgi:hypothetical protein